MSDLQIVTVCSRRNNKVFGLVRLGQGHKRRVKPSTISPLFMTLKRRVNKNENGGQSIVDSVINVVSQTLRYGYNSA